MSVVLPALSDWVVPFYTCQNAAMVITEVYGEFHQFLRVGHVCNSLNPADTNINFVEIVKGNCGFYRGRQHVHLTVFIFHRRVSGPF